VATTLWQSAHPAASTACLFEVPLPRSLISVGPNCQLGLLCARFGDLLDIIFLLLYCVLLNRSHHHNIWAWFAVLLTPSYQVPVAEHNAAWSETMQMCMLYGLAKNKALVGGQTSVHAHAPLILSDVMCIQPAYTLYALQLFWWWSKKVTCRAQDTRTNRHTHRQTDRQADRQTAGSQTDNQPDYIHRGRDSTKGEAAIFG
jgi:hypothetical protein